MTYRSIPYTILSTNTGWLALAWIGPHIIYRDGISAVHVETAIRALIDWSLA